MRESLDPSERPSVVMLRPPHRKATLIMLSSALLLITWKYFGTPGFYLEHFSGANLPLGGKETAAALYHFGCSLILLGLVPMAIVKFAFRERLADYGVQAGDLKLGLKFVVLTAPLILVIAWLASGSESIRAEYPLNRQAHASTPLFGLHALTYLMFYLGWEFHFRGYLQFGLAQSTGRYNALWIQVLASTLLHIGKPAGETYGSILAGVFWGIIAMRSRSLLSGFLQHALLGIALDYFICYG